MGKQTQQKDKFVQGQAMGKQSQQKDRFVQGQAMGRESQQKTPAALAHPEAPRSLASSAPLEPPAATCHSRCPSLGVCAPSRATVVSSRLS
jgi:hypothetical protein